MPEYERSLSRGAKSAECRLQLKDEAHLRATRSASVSSMRDEQLLKTLPTAPKPYAAPVFRLAPMESLTNGPSKAVMG